MKESDREQELTGKEVAKKIAKENKHESDVLEVECGMKCSQPAGEQHCCVLL